MRYLIIGELGRPPYETDDIDVVLDQCGKGAKIYKPVMFKTLEEIQNEDGN